MDIFGFDFVLTKKAADSIADVIQVNDMAIHNSVGNKIGMTNVQKLISTVFDRLEFHHFDGTGANVNTNRGLGTTETQQPIAKLLPPFLTGVGYVQSKPG